MRLKQIADFLTVVDSGSIRAAARMLGVSQPAITRSLRRLEADLGVQLLQRTPQGILLTPRGRAFYGRARVAYAELEKAQAEITDGQTDESTVTFGVGPTVGSLVVPQAVARFRTQFPMTQVRIVEGLSHHLAPLVRDGTLDFAVGARPRGKEASALSVKPLFTHELVIAARKGHVLRKATSLQELAHADWASCVPPPFDRSPVKSLFAKARQAAPRDAIQCESYHLLVSLVAETSILGVLTKKLMSVSPARDRLEIINVQEPLPSYAIHMVTRKGVPLGGAAASLAGAITLLARRLV